MKLYYSPGACALASQIALREAGLKFEMIKVDLANKTTSEGDYNKVNPKGYVPALKADSGEVYTEGAVILQRIADQVPDKKLLPKWGSDDRYRAMEWLNFVATEIHKGFSPLFNKALAADARETLAARLHVRLEFLNNHLEKNKFMLGQEFSVIDAYVFNVVRWAQPMKLDISKYKGILGLLERVGTRPSAQAAIEAETPGH